MVLFFLLLEGNQFPAPAIGGQEPIYSSLEV